MAKSRLDMRREVEAAEALEKAPGAKKKAGTKAATTKKAKTPAEKKKKTTRKKAASRSRKTKETPSRRRLVWVIYSSTMREEGRFLYHERDKAEEKLEALLSKGKRRYFIQPIKEALDAEGKPLNSIDMTAPPEDHDDLDDEPVKKASVDAEADDGDDVGDDVEVPEVAEDDGD